MKYVGVAFRYITICIVALIMIFPFYWMVISGFKSFSELAQLPPTFLPAQWNAGNFLTVFTRVPILRYLANSFFVALWGTLLTLFTTVTAAFAISFYDFKWKKGFLYAILFTMCVPFEVIVITNYATIVNLGLNDTIAALILPFSGNLFFTHLMVSAFQTASQKIYRAARVDGASKLVFLWRVLIPSSGSLILALGLFNFVSSWNSFMWPMLVIKSEENRTLPFSLYAFMTEGGERFELMMAMSVIMVIPLVLIFLLFRKTMTRGSAGR